MEYLRQSPLVREFVPQVFFSSFGGEPQLPIVQTARIGLLSHPESGWLNYKSLEAMSVRNAFRARIKQLTEWATGAFQVQKSKLRGGWGV